MRVEMMVARTEERDRGRDEGGGFATARGGRGEDGMTVVRTEERDRGRDEGGGFATARAVWTKDPKWWWWGWCVRMHLPQRFAPSKPGAN